MPFQYLNDLLELKKSEGEVPKDKVSDANSSNQNNKGP